jgi:hypothetical protein
VRFQILALFTSTLKVRLSRLVNEQTLQRLGGSPFNLPKQMIKRVRWGAEERTNAYEWEWEQCMRWLKSKKSAEGFIFIQEVELKKTSVIIIADSAHLTILAVVGNTYLQIGRQARCWYAEEAVGCLLAPICLVPNLY